MTSDLINKCQYWSLYEPPQCVHWNVDQNICDYKTNVVVGDISFDSIITPKLAPYCNLIGTGLGCDKYSFPTDSITYHSRCILPDQSRHVCNRETGEKWVTASGIGDISDDGYQIYLWDFSDINGYNEGQCDGFGTKTTCSGYGSQHLGFGELAPSDSQVDSFEDSRYTKTEELGYRLPTNYVIYNIRALLSKCRWWNGYYGKFVINDTGVIELNTSWACYNPNDTSIHSELSEEFGAPCNGCKPECDYYSGVCWQYCIDNYMKTGDPILSEHIHEIRYYFRENNWKKEQIEKYFADEGNIYTWYGSVEDLGGSKRLRGDIKALYSTSGEIEEYEIPSYRTYMKTFDFFMVDYEYLILSEGTKVDEKLTNFPTLIREISTLPLDPIIKNRFEVNRLISSEYGYHDGPGIFESHLLADTTMLVYGKVFHEENVYAINISDKDIYSVIPKQIYEYDNMLDIRLELGEHNFSFFYNLFYDVIELLKIVVPDKIFSDKLPKTNSSFITEVPIFYSDKTYSGLNENIIMVFQDSPDGILFSKLRFYREFVGGVLLQNDFNIEGDLGKKAPQPYDYTKSFMSHVNKNGHISFKFCPFGGKDFYPKVSHFYNDLYMPKEYSPTQIPPEKPTVYVGSKLYKITTSYYIISLSGEPDEVEFYQLGSDGYILINLLHDRINNTVLPWEAESIEVVGEDVCELEIVYHGSDGKLAPNQVIVRPKDAASFKNICHGGGSIIFKNLSYYEKRSYDQDPTGISDVYAWDYEVVEDENLNYSYFDIGELEEVYEDAAFSFIIYNFKFTMVPSVVIEGRSGRPFTQYRTKAIGWCKQPYCQDVEIKYSWTANYTKWENHSDKGVCNCCGGWYQKNSSSSTYWKNPPCGDHDIFSVTKTGPMWWPYNACDSYATYDIVNNLDNYSVDVIGLFKLVNDDEEGGGDGVRVHGDHDMRMLGPANKIAFHGDGCNFLIKCTCDWRTYNNYKIGTNYFTGWARLRGFVSNTELAIWKNEGEVLPKFGNFNRPNLLSYRTIDSWQYTYSYDGVKWFVDWMIMPAYASFTKCDFTDMSDVRWDVGASTYGTNVVNPLGMYIAEDMDGLPTAEKVDYIHRFRFDDVFNCRFCVDGIRYPNTVGEYVQIKKQGKIYPWYEFKPYNVVVLTDGLDEGGFGEYHIQWAWQEVWKSLERMHNKYHDNLYSFVNELLNKDKTDKNRGPFVPVSGKKEGVFNFLIIDHPNYKYDFKNEEKRLVIEEGEHKINFYAPIKDFDTGEYIDYIGISIDEGPMRGIKYNGQWLTKDDVSEKVNDDPDAIDNPNYSKYNIKLYDECIGDGTTPVDAAISGTLTIWSDEVTIFENGASVEKSDEKVIEYFIMDLEENEYKVEEYFNRGLKVYINSENFTGSYLPTEIDISQYEMIMGSETDSLIVGVFDSEILSFKHINTEGSEAVKKTIRRVEISFNFGAELLSVTLDPITGKENKIFNVYHIPQVTIIRSEDGTSEDEILYTTNGMDFYNYNSSEDVDLDIKMLTIEWSNNLEYIINGSNFLIIKLRLTPTIDETETMSVYETDEYNKNINLVKPVVIDLFEEVLHDASENIRTWERKYYVSYSESGDCPPQGSNQDKSSFAPRQNHKSTVYQQDTNEGINNIEGSENPIKMQSKIFSRFVYEITNDKDSVVGTVSQIEEKQKELYDRAISEDIYDSMMSHIIPPGMSNLLNNAMVYYKPSAQLYLHNSLINELADINSPKPMSGEGYLYLPGEPNNGRCTRSPCEGTAPPSWLYEFVGQDPNSDPRYSGRGYSSPLLSFYGGAATMMMRIYLAQAVNSGIFGPLYGSTAGNKIWLEPENISDLILYDLDCIYSSVPIPPPIHWNLTYFATAMNWHNAYFNTQKYFNIDSEETNF